MLSHFLETATTSLLLILVISTPGEAYECIKTPPSPLNGKLLGPYGTVTARLVCPKGFDIPLSAPDKGLLECNPYEIPYSFINVHRHQCLPLLTPSSLKMYMRFNFVGPSCSRVIITHLTNSLIQNLLKFQPSSKPRGPSTDWLTPKVACAPALYQRSRKQQNRLMVEVPLRISPYNQRDGYAFYLQLFDGIRTWYSNKSRSDKIIQGVKTPGYQFEYFEFSDLYSSCEDHPHTIDISVNDYKMVSCRGCPRDYVLPKGSKKCDICMAHFYTREPFADRCIPCPPNSEWRETEELYEKYCVKFQADYD